MKVAEILFYIVLGLAVYFIGRVATAAVKVLSEVFVAFRIIAGRDSHRNTDRPLRLYTFVCETEYLDEVTINELFYFIHENTDSRMVLLSYSHVQLFRDKIDGSLRGMMLTGFVRRKNYTLLKLGLMYFRNFYKGGPYMYIASVYFVLRELILHPFTPLYVVGKSFSFKSYLATLAFREGYPRYDKETPENYKQMFNEFAHTVMAPGEEYDEKTGVLKREVSFLTENHLVVTEEDMKNPHIRFFMEQNPGWTKGHCLIAGVKMGWIDLLYALNTKVVQKIWRKETKKGSSRTTKRKKPKLLKRYTFHEKSANAYAIDLFETDIGGDVALSPTNNYAFQFPSHDDDDDDEPSLSPIKI